ncbi:MAG: acylphosphatase [Phycisphaerales bacterium]|nr:acylphosphatase [Phycisphaerales bacterium]
MQRRTCLFSGRVQGVGFRYTAHNIALQHDVSGYVRNLADGRVEMVMEGPEEEIAAVVRSLSERLGGYIKQVDEEVYPPTGEFRQFLIRH